MKHLVRAVGFISAIAVAVGFFAFVVYGFSTSPRVMQQLMVRHVDIPSSGLPEEELSGVVHAITDYLRGALEELQYSFTDEASQVFLCFNAHEQLHMADVRQLFQLCKHLRWPLTFIPVLLLLWSKSSDLVGGIMRGLDFVGILIAAVVLWGIADFDGLFLTFHRVFFRNDLWLMNPNQDLIIRLMPTRFFVEYSAIIALSWFVCMLLLWMASHRKRSKPHA